MKKKLAKEIQEKINKKEYKVKLSVKMMNYMVQLNQLKFQN